MSVTKGPENSAPNKKHRNIGDIFRELYEAIVVWFQKLFDLEAGMDREGTIIAIKTGKRMQGANAWLLMCSIMIASLGLDLGSPAVIIGAMLISPLMSPILGVGLAVGINDREALFISLRHFGIAILIALVTSTLYFLITPLGQFTEEISSRTAPTILDGLVAVFGGLAGIISTSRKDKTNAIPGVAIATALMPPLCVTGYGLAKGNWWVMINSFYLFFLNSFFIAVTTYLIIRFLNFPFKAYLNEREALRTRWIITAFSLIIILPSARILYRVIVDQKNSTKAEEFVSEYFGPEDPTRCIGFKYIKGDTSNQLILEVLGKKISEDSLTYFYGKLENDYGLSNTNLTIIQDADLGLDQLNRMQLELSNLGQIADKFQSVNKAKSAQELEIQRLMAQLDSIRADTLPFQKIYQEAQVLFQKMDAIGYAKAQKTDFKTHPGKIPVFLVDWNRSKSRSERRRDEEKLYEFLKLRAELDTLEIIAY